MSTSKPIDFTNLPLVCDEMLKELNFKDNHEHIYLYDGHFVRQYSIGSAKRALTQLVNDKYVTKGDKDHNTDPNQQPNFSYTITPLGQHFIETTGYQRKLKDDVAKEKYALELPQSVMRSNKVSRRVLRTQVVIGCITIIISGTAAYLSWLNYLSGADLKTRIKSLETQQQQQSMKQLQFQDTIHSQMESLRKNLRDSLRQH